MNRDMRPYALLLELGWTLAVSIVGSLVLGVLFDRFMGTSPIGLLVFSLVGILAGSLSVYRQVAAAIAAVEEEQREKKREKEKQNHEEVEIEKHDSDRSDRKEEDD